MRKWANLQVSLYNFHFSKFTFVKYSLILIEVSDKWNETVFTGCIKYVLLFSFIDFKSQSLTVCVKELWPRIIGYTFVLKSWKALVQPASHSFPSTVTNNQLIFHQEKLLTSVKSFSALTYLESTNLCKEKFGTVKNLVLILSMRNIQSTDTIYFTCHVIIQ